MQDQSHSPQRVRMNDGIVARLKGLQAKMANLESASGIIQTGSLAFVLFGVLIAITMVSWLPSTARLLIDLVALAVLAIATYFWVVVPLVNRRSFLQIARLLEGKYGKFQTRLIAALELHEQAIKNRENYSIELIEKTIEQAGGIIGEIDTAAVIDYKPVKRALAQAGALLVAVLIGLFINSGAIYDTFRLYSQPLSNYEKPPDFELTLEPGSGEFFRNADLAVKAKFIGRAPRKIELHYRFEDGAWTSEAMAKPDSVSPAAFSYTFKKVKRSVEFFAKSGRVQSQRVRLDIIDPPRLTDINLKFDYPEYSGMPDASGNPNDGNVTALRGTKVSLEGKTNKALLGAFLAYSDSSTAPLTVDGERVTGEFKVLENTRYTVSLIDQSSRLNPEPIWYDIQAVEDYPPSITIRFPNVDVDLDEQITLPLEIAIADDYGFGKLNLVYWIMSEGQQTEPARQGLIIPDKSSLDQIVKYSWNMESLNPLPGDMVYYYCEVSDNDIVSGPKWTKTKTFSARLPNLDEILADVEGAQQEQIETLEEALRDQHELQKKLDEISRDMLKSSDVNWEKQQEAKQVLEKQEALAKELEKLSQEMQKNLEKLEENSLMSEEIAEKMQEIQRLMEEVAPPELKEAMKKLQEAIQNMDPNELKKALENFKLTSEQMLENLDRALSLLQKLAIEQKMDMLVQLAEKITEDQEMVNQAAFNAGDSSSMAQNMRPQKNVSDEFNVLKEQFGQLQQMDQEPNMIPNEEEQAAEQKVNDPQVPKEFEEMQKSLCKNDGGACQSKGKNIKKKLQEMTNSLKAAQKAMQDQQKEDIARKMQKAAEDLLYLSDRQELLLDSTRAYEQTGDGLRTMASSQMNIAGASSRVADAISELSKETIFINLTLMRLLGMTLADMNDAIGHLDRRFAQGAVQSEQSAMSNLNKTVYMLLQAKDNTMCSSSGSGMQEIMKQMEQMSKMQSGINDQTMMQMPQPGMPMSLGQQQAMQQLAAQQEALRKQLEELNDEFGKRGEMLGRLDQLGEEMKKVVEDMQRSRVGDETIKRQENVLSRMLDAQKSVNRREYSKKRQSEQGIDIVRRSPSAPDDQSGDDAWLSEMIKKALEEEYPRQYEKLIRAYFKSFQNQGEAIENE
jgi:hypothetical protein